MNPARRGRRPRARGGYGGQPTGPRALKRKGRAGFAVCAGSFQERGRGPRGRAVAQGPRGPPRGRLAGLTGRLRRHPAGRAGGSVGDQERASSTPGLVSWASPAASRSLRASWMVRALSWWPSAAVGSPSWATVCIAPPAHNAARTQRRDGFKGGGRPSRSSGSSGSTSTALWSGEAKSVGSSARTLRRTRNARSASSPPDHLHAQDHGGGAVGPMARWATPAEVSTRPQAPGPTPLMRLAPWPSPVLFQWVTTGSPLAHRLDAGEDGAHGVQVGAGGGAGDRQVQRVNDHQGGGVFVQLAGGRLEFFAAGELGDAKAQPQPPPSGQLLQVSCLWAQIACSRRIIARSHLPREHQHRPGRRAAEVAEPGAAGGDRDGQVQDGPGLAGLVLGGEDAVGVAWPHALISQAGGPAAWTRASTAARSSTTSQPWPGPGGPRSPLPVGGCRGNTSASSPGGSVGSGTPSRSRSGRPRSSRWSPLTPHPARRDRCPSG
jgi:hypothetical protein